VALFGGRRRRRIAREDDPPFGAAPEDAIPTDPIGLPDFLARLRIGDRSRLTNALIAAGATRLGLPAAVFRTVVDVESADRAGFAPNGLPAILFEPHVFSELTSRRHDSANPDISYRDPDPRKLPQSQDLRWRQLAKAFVIDEDAALKATRWGMFQILGLHHAACGFASAAGLAAGMAGSEARQLEALEEFLIAHGLVDVLKEKHWTGFAAKYEGPANAKAHGARLARAYRALTAKRPA
jgi:hypothetical protein